MLGWIGPDAQPLDPGTYGDRAGWLSRAAALGLPVPPAVAVPAEAVAALAAGGAALREALAPIEAATGMGLGDARAPLLLSLRPGRPGCGGAAPAILDIGMCAATRPALVARLGAHVAAEIERRMVQSFGTGALGIESEDFEYALHDALKHAGAESETELGTEALQALTATCRALIADEDAEIPDDPWDQLAIAIAAMRRAWDSRRARIRREAMGLDPDMALTLVLERMALGLGPEPSGAGIARLRHEATGARGLTGRYLAQAQGEEARMGLRTPQVLTEAERRRLRLPEPALEDSAPQVVAELDRIADRVERAFADAFTLDFTVTGGALEILDLRPSTRGPRAAVRIAVELAEMGVIERRDALLRTEPRDLDDHLHPTIAPNARRDRIAQGLPASPGAASGPLVFSPDAAEQAATAGTPAILALVETGPEDIRGMHAAAGVLTIRGGMTSHAAVVARGLGRPCVVGARSLMLDTRKGELKAADGRAFHAGDLLTVEGSEGEVIAGAVETRPPEITGAFASLMGWADAVRRMGVRANADTGPDAAVARGFNAGGIGLCRTEHMFFQRGRITAMREMILAESTEERRTALSHLQPMQKRDFADLFREMAGHPVVIRMLDPPLHEFLPHGDEELEQMAEVLAVPVEKVRARALDLAEFNPMLGKRGCRIGIAYPEIYEMQARAIFEAACEAGRATGHPVRPEIMIPLISAVRELEVLRGHIDAVADAIREERGEMVPYTVGVMIETPRACLRAGDIARVADFLSFGTNDLTQMLYGLSRDDAGRFMPDYVSQGVFAHDPFHRIDEEGVGEIIRLATERARQARPGISIGLCGEHGGDPASVAFCERAGFDYVSCSPYRVPIARLAAAQATLRTRRA